MEEKGVALRGDGLPDEQPLGACGTLKPADAHDESPAAGNLASVDFAGRPDEPAETPEDIAAREAAEKAALEAETAAARARADESAREERARSAVERLSRGAGWSAQAGIYYDATHGAVKATTTPAERARVESDRRLSDASEGQTAIGPTAQPETPEPALVGGTVRVDDLDTVQTAEADAGYIDPVVFGRMVAKVTQAVTRNPLQRELFYKVLDFCQESKPLRDIEQMVAALPGFERASSNPYHFIAVMEQAGGLERFELDEEGDVVDEERKRGLTADEVDDLVAQFAFMTTPAGQAVVEQHTPRARLVELLGLVPERRDTYVELMEFLADEPRTYSEVNQLLAGRDVLWRLDSRGNPERMQPSVFLDKLHGAAAIEWRQGWQLTDDGRDYLEELKAVSA